MAAVSSTLMSALTTGAGISTPTRQKLVTGRGQDLDFWVLATAVRTYAVTAPLCWGLLRKRPSTGLLVAAGLTQFGDAYLCARTRNPVGAAATAAMGLLHLLSARSVVSRG